MVRSFLFEREEAYDREMLNIEEILRKITGGEKPDFYRGVHEAIKNAFCFGKDGKETEVTLNIYEGQHFLKATVCSDSLPFDCVAYRNCMQVRALANDVNWTELVTRQMPGRGIWRMLENSDFIIFGNGEVHLYLKKPYQKNITRRAQGLVIRFFIKDESGNIA